MFPFLSEFKIKIACTQFDISVAKVTEAKIHISYFSTKLSKLLSLFFVLQNIAEKLILTYVFHFTFHSGDFQTK